MPVTRRAFTKPLKVKSNGILHSEQAIQLDYTPDHGAYSVNQAYALIRDLITELRTLGKDGFVRGTLHGPNGPIVLREVPLSENPDDSVFVNYVYDYQIVSEPIQHPNQKSISDFHVIIRLTN